jgi:hypothetical protein
MPVEQNDMSVEQRVLMTLIFHKTSLTAITCLANFVQMKVHQNPKNYPLNTEFVDITSHSNHHVN